MNTCIILYRAIQCGGQKKQKKWDADHPPGNYGNKSTLLWWADQSPINESSLVSAKVNIYKHWKHSFVCTVYTTLQRTLRQEGFCSSHINIVSSLKIQVTSYNRNHLYFTLHHAVESVKSMFILRCKTKL